MTEKGKYN